MAKATVVITCYNNYDTISKTYNSVLNQTYKNFEVIIVNDGSDQQTTSILNSFSNDKLTVMHQQNQGVVTARNNGIKKSNSEYILMLDADDYLENSFLEKAISILQLNSKIGVVTSYYNVYNKNRFLRLVQLQNLTNLEDFLKENRIPSNALFRKICWEQVNGYDTLFNQGYEDWDYWLSISINGWDFEIIKEPLLNIVIRKNSRNREAMINDLELKKKIFIKHSQLYKNSFNCFVDNQIAEMVRLKQTIRKRDNSIEMRIGKLILTPIRKIKKIFSK